MTRRTQDKKKVRTQHSQSFKNEALGLAEKVGVAHRVAGSLIMRATSTAGYNTSPTSLERAGAVVRGHTETEAQPANGSSK